MRCERLVGGALLLALATLGTLPHCAKELPDLKIGGDFELTDTAGKRFSLKEQRGKVVLLFFGFTHCPDFCPSTLSKVNAALKQLNSEQKSRVQLIMVTVDPQRDTPKKLREYLAAFDANAIGLTGTLDELRAVVRDYGGMFAKSSQATAAGYLVDHSPYLYVLGPQGRVRFLFKFRDTPDTLVGVIRRLL